MEILLFCRYTANGLFLFMLNRTSGKVGLLYEKYDSWSRNELHLKNILKYEKFTIDELKVQP